VERLARSDGHKARSEGETDLPAKELKVGAAAEILKRLFPTGRKHHKREELKAIVERELGYEISLETLKRAMRDAWGVAQTGSK
jgi:hypothetical protein